MSRTPSTGPTAAVLVLTAGAAIGAWAAYKLRTAARPAATRANKTIDSAPFESTSSGQPWDIGTGAAGYRWQRPGARGVVLFQHGYGDYTQRWVHGASSLILRLLKAGFDVYGFDMWGSGRSPGKPGVTDVEAAINDHLAARKLLREQPLPVFLIGHSLGGLVTITSALRDPLGIAGIVLISPAIKYNLPTAAVVAAQVGGFLMPTLPGPLPAGKVEMLTHVPSAVAALREDPLMYTGRVSWLTAAGGAAISTANWRQYVEITAPLLAIHGEDDQNTDPTGSVDLVAAVSSDDAELILVDGGWHSLLDDDAGPEVVDALLLWLDGHIQ